MQWISQSLLTWVVVTRLRTLGFAGGSAAQSELIHQRVRSLAQQTGTPVYTFAEDVAASGG